jgi:hypothetical protein
VIYARSLDIDRHVYLIEYIILGGKKMKIMESKPNRNNESGLFVRDGEFAYKIEHTWAKWPSEVKGSDVLGASCNKDGNLL